MTLQWDVAKIVRSSIKKSCVSVFTTRKHAFQCTCNYRRAVAGVVSTEPRQARAEHQPVRQVADTTALIMECSKKKAAVAAPLLYTCLTKKRKRGGEKKNDILDVCHPSAETLGCRPPCAAVMSIYSAVIAARLPLSTIGHRNAAGIPSACFSQQMFSHYSPECKQWFRLLTFPPAGKRLLKSLITRQVSISRLLLQAG